jgi:signal transduction histidine kinase
MNEREAEHIALRHEHLRRAAPAVQHEVNNALMVLGSNLELLARAATEAAPRRQLERALEAVRRLDETVRGFLDAARRDASEFCEESPVVVLAQLLPLLRVALGPRLGFEMAPGGAALPKVRLDRARLELALLCLAGDAARRMAPGARIVARGEARGAAALVLALPDGAMPQGDAACLLAEAMRLSGGVADFAAPEVRLVWGQPAAG